jgi:Protein of unknown function DUF262/Protein of unknown function (DUF1524)
MSTLSSRMRPLEEVFAVRRFVPAAVQRDYQWGESQCRELLDDIVRVFEANERGPAAAASASEADEEPTDELEPPSEESIPAALIDSAPPAYFLGTIVLRPGESGAFEVYDGFQRLTTLVLLFAVTRDLASALPPVQHRLHALVVAGGTPRIRLRGNGSDLTKVAAALGSTVDLKAPRPSNQTLAARLRRAARVFRDGLSRWAPERLERFVQFLLTQVYLATIEIDDDRIARQTFITTNARGLPLNPANVLKGQLVDLVEEQGGDAQVLDVWNNIEQRLGVPGFVAFLRALDFVYRATPQGPEYLTDLGEHLRIHLRNLNPTALADSLALHARAWDQLLAAIDDPERDPYGGDLWRLGLFEWPEWRPYALKLLASRLRSGNGPSVARLIGARFAELHRRCMMFTLLGWTAAQRGRAFAASMNRKRNPLEPTGPLSLSIAEHARLERLLRDGVIQHEATQTALLRWLESTLRSPIAPWVGRGVVEAVWPAEPEHGSAWASAEPPSGSESLSNRLGNLTLVSPEVQQRAANREFLEKVAAFRTDKFEFLVTVDVRSATRWDLAAIEQRTHKLAGWIADKLGLGSA